MNKRVLLLLSLTFCMIVPTYSFAYTDVEGHWAEKEIRYATDNEIINGYLDNTFRPNDYMTRAELATVIDNMIGIESESDKYIADSVSRDWYYSNLRKALYFGIIQGNQKGMLNPDYNVTREEAVTMIARAFKIELGSVDFNSDYTDASKISEWARKEFISFIRKNYITGYEDNTVRPNNNITRAEIVTIMSRVIKNIKSSIYSARITGNTLVKDRNVILNSVDVYGDLIIGEIASKSINLSNVIVNGNLILYAPVDLEKNTVAVNGSIINAYETTTLSNKYYTNIEYGISFPIPDRANAFDGAPKNGSDFSKKDMIIVNVFKDDSYYYMKMDDIAKVAISKLEYDSIFKKTSEGDINKYPYELYTDNVSADLLIIKRDNIIYTIIFANIASKNIINNVISNVTFTDGAEVTNHENVIYRNSKLALKFSYKNGYVGVDDSYNTNVVYSGDSIFKLFIQVNMITDINEYSIEQIQTLLKSFVKNDGKIMKEEVMKINNHNAIKFEIQSDDDQIISLYVIIGNNLYNFIFRGETEKIDTIGRDMFNTIVNSMEF